MKTTPPDSAEGTDRWQMGLAKGDLGASAGGIEAIQFGGFGVLRSRTEARLCFPSAKFDRRPRSISEREQDELSLSYT